MSDALTDLNEGEAPRVGARAIQRPRPDVRAFLDYLAAQDAPRTHQVDPGTARDMMRMLTTLADPPVDAGVHTIEAMCPGAGSGLPDGSGAHPLPVRLYLPQGHVAGAAGPVVLFLHGGGFVIGDTDTYASVIAHMASRLRLPVVSVDYRLAPEHPFPAAPDDAEAAARWLATSPDALGLDVTGLVIAGDSAGGNLTIVTTQALAARPAAVPVLAQFPIYPVVDSTRIYPSYIDHSDGYLLDAATMRWFTDHYAAEAADIRTSPILADDHAAMPPTLVLTAGLDPLRDQGRAYAARLIHEGVNVTYQEARGIIHGFITLRQAIPSGQADLDMALDTLAAMIARAAARAVRA